MAQPTKSYSIEDLDDTKRFIRYLLTTAVSRVALGFGLGFGAAVGYAVTNLGWSVL